LANSSPKGNAWVAGPVVGSAAGVALIVALYYFWRRRRPKSLTGEVQEKDGRPLHPQDPQSPQVETESVKELSIERANSTVYEMPGSTPPISEKPANEVPAQELPANANRD
jgi:hypothetical protein